MKRFIIASFAILALSGTAMAGNGYGDQSKEDSYIQGSEKANPTHENDKQKPVPSEGRNTFDDGSVEDTDSKIDKSAAPTDPAPIPNEGQTVDDDGSPEE